MDRRRAIAALLLAFMAIGIFGGVGPGGPTGAFAQATDTDGDLVTDVQEAELGTDPTEPDTDDDGLTDYQETGLGVADRPTCDELDPDTDGDGLLDGEEFLQPGLDCLDPDTDDDGANDGDEIAAGTDPFDDADGDFLSDAQEAALGSDPNDPDTDGDGLNDFECQGLFCPSGEPTCDPTVADTDGDGLGDAAEFDSGTPCTDPDVDDDGANDKAEVDAGTDPYDPESFPGQGPATGTLIVRAFACPVAYAGDNFAADCDDPLTGAPFFAKSPVGGDKPDDLASTDASGVVRFADVIAAEVVFGYTDAITLAQTGVAAIRLSCQDADAAVVVARTDADGDEFLDLAGGAEVTCDYYVVPDAAPAPTATGPSKATATATVGAGTTPVRLPNTGVGGPSDRDAGVPASALAVSLIVAAVVGLLGTNRRRIGAA